MSGIVKLQLWQFSLIYLLLIVVSLVMKKPGQPGEKFCGQLCA